MPRLTLGDIEAALIRLARKYGCEVFSDHHNDHITSWPGIVNLSKLAEDLKKELER